MNKGLVVRIAVPIAVLLLVGGAFLLKKAQAPATAAASAAVTIPAEADTGSGKTVIASAGSESPSPAGGGGDLLITTTIDFEGLRSSGLPVIIDFGADSCIPCKEMAPVLADLNKSLAGKAIIKFVDVWKYRDLSEGVPINVIPTQIFFDSTGKPFTPSDSLQVPLTMYSLKDTDEHVFTTHEGGLDKPQMLAILKEMGMK
jgi:thioredoxin 1